ncbi:hypothetical protein BJ508DRAFT_158637 [Ascobolus immersus RN42]|uniref:Uncharacterized protein n=1 Tax=Ascobolus immersus RN42 TaxID=1160509 RepID=A0A3N4IP33_ASCIM|nr:hypothetical protein BJ508DRAFT_158637 [Ascobolus immersus RN42]
MGHEEDATLQDGRHPQPALPHALEDDSESTVPSTAKDLVLKTINAGSSFCSLTDPRSLTPPTQASKSSAEIKPLPGRPPSHDSTHPLTSSLPEPPAVIEHTPSNEATHASSLHNKRPQAADRLLAHTESQLPLHTAAALPVKEIDQEKARSNSDFQYSTAFMFGWHDESLNENFHLN